MILRPPRSPVCPDMSVFLFFFNDTATTEIYTLSLHDALPISSGKPGQRPRRRHRCAKQRPRPDPARHSRRRADSRPASRVARSEEHTSELQSRQYLVCRLLLEKKKTQV